MKHYAPPKKDLWTGRVSNKWLYLHEKAHCTPLEELPEAQKKSIALLGYACDAGVRRNQGRIGAAEGPDSIKNSFGKMPNHLGSNVLLPMAIITASKSIWTPKKKDRPSVSSILMHILTCGKTRSKATQAPRFIR